MQQENDIINVESDVEDKIVSFLIELKNKYIYNKVCQKMMQRIANYEELCSEEWQNVDTCSVSYSIHLLSLFKVIKYCLIVWRTMLK